jgi:hypothetical protein
MTINSPVVPAWSSGKLIVTLIGVPKSSTVSAVATSGQVTVTPTTPQPVSMGSAIVEIGLQAKKKSSSVIINGPCGSKTVMVNVQ